MRRQNENPVLMTDQRECGCSLNSSIIATPHEERHGHERFVPAAGAASQMDGCIPFGTRLTLDPPLTLMRICSPAFRKGSSAQTSPFYLCATV